MTQLQVDILLVILKSQLEVEEKVYEKLQEMRKNYDTTWISDNISISITKISEIKRQINILETK